MNPALDHYVPAAEEVVVDARRQVVLVHHDAGRAPHRLLAQAYVGLGWVGLGLCMVSQSGNGICCLGWCPEAWYDRPG